jgi:hypothetical protein
VFLERSLCWIKSERPKGDDWESRFSLTGLACKAVFETRQHPIRVAGIGIVSHASSQNVTLTGEFFLIGHHDITAVTKVLSSTNWFYAELNAT